MVKLEVTPEVLGGFLEHTLLDPVAQCDDIARLCEQANKIGSYVCVNESRAEQAVSYAKGAGNIKGVAAVVGFPFGATSTDIKVYSMKKMFDLGCSAVDIVMNVGYFKDSISGLERGSYTPFGTELREIFLEASSYNEKNKTDKEVKIILENCHLDTNSSNPIHRSEVYIASFHITRIACNYDALRLFLKTSTGYGRAQEGRPIGAREDDVQKMKDGIESFHGPRGKVGIKVSGGIRTFGEVIGFHNLVQPLPFRVGTSSGLKIWEDYCRFLNNVLG